MTRDEIQKMPAGRELDALIAEKVMGLKLDPSREYLVAERKDGWGYLASNYPIPNYSTDIADAWGVVEMLEAAGIGFQLANVIPNSDPVVYEVMFMKAISNYYACEFSVPLAICRAALLTVTEVTL